MDAVLDGSLEDREVLFAVVLHVVRHGKITLEQLARTLELAGEPTLIDEAAEVIEAEQAIEAGEEVPLEDPEIEDLIAEMDGIEADG